MHSGDTDIQLRRIVTRSCIDSVRRWMLPVGREHRKLVVAPWQTPPHSTLPSLFPPPSSFATIQGFRLPLPWLALWAWRSRRAPTGDPGLGSDPTTTEG